MASDRDSELLEAYSAGLIGLPVSHLWRGYGSAIFVELGALGPARMRRDGSLGNPKGEMSLMIEWGWRIEGPRSIYCGSDADEKSWSRAFARLTGAYVEAAELVGRLPEIAVRFSNGLHLVSSMLAEGQPQWALFDNRGVAQTWINVERGRVVQGEARHRTVISPP